MAVELATGYVSVVPSAKGFGNALGKEIGDPLESEGRHAGDRAGKGFSGTFGNGLKSIAAVAGPALAALGIGTIIQGSITAASDMNETLSKSNTIFGDQGGAIEAWATTAAKGFGQSKLQALDAASTFGNIFDQLGVGKQQSAGLSTSLTELASDFASFHNAAPTDVIEAMTSAFRGEYDAVQRYVPTITAATVEQKALAMTGKATTKELTAQEKALATQALLFEGAGQAMGDFDRTSGSLANQQRTMGALWEDLSAKLGAKLLPVMSKITEFIIDKVIPGIESLSKVFSGDILGNLEAKLGAAAPALRDVVETFRSAFDGLVVIIRTTVRIVSELWSRFGEGLVNIIRGQLQVLAGIFDFIKAILTGKWGEAWDALLKIVDGFWIQIKGIVTLGWEALKGLFEAALFALGDVVTGGLSAVVGFFAALPGLILGALGDVASWLVGKGVDIVVGLITGYLSVIGQVTDFFTSLGGWIVGWVGDAGGFLFGKGRDVIGGMLGGLGSAIGGLAGFIGSIGGSVIGWIGDAAGWLIGKGRDIIGGLINGINQVFGGVAGRLWELNSEVLGVYADAASWLYNAGRSIVEGLLSGIRSMAGAAADAARSVVSNAISAAWSALKPGSPSKVFAEMGENAVAGFVLGVSRSTPAAVSQMGRFVGAVTSADLRVAHGLGAGGSVGYGGAGGITNNVYVTNPMPTGNDVSDAVAWTMKTAGR